MKLAKRTPRNALARKRNFFAALALLFGTACGAPPPPVERLCMDYAVAGLHITVLDGGGERVQRKICDAEVVAAEGAYEERLEAPNHSDCAYQGAWERPGTYALWVTKEGFRTATLEDIRVQADECHVQTESRTVTLIPQ